MGTGILICGLNGSGKSTLGKALAERLQFHFIDNEDLYFPKTDSRYLYASPRTREEVTELLFHEINLYENFVFASVKGDYGESFYPFLQYAILLNVPKLTRLQRVRDRSFQKFGVRALPGGDLYEREKSFFDLVCSRGESTVEDWVKELACPILRMDGTRPIEENLDNILTALQGKVEI